MVTNLGATYAARPAAFGIPPMTAGLESRNLVHQLKSSGIPDAAGLAAYVAPKLVSICDYCFGIRQGVCRRITVSASDCWPI